jgi:ammonium transporter, Amt family
MKKFIPLGALIFVVALALVFPSVKTVTIANNKIDSGDTAWMLTATALCADHDSRPCIFLWWNGE